jgi:hypothetical protein
MSETKPVYDSISMEQIIDTLEFAGVRTSFPDGDECLNRTILFTVCGVDYKIVWYCNQSTLSTQSPRSWQYPFHWVRFDSCYPMVGGNNNLTFSKDKQADFYSFYLALPMPYGGEL